MTKIIEIKNVTLESGPKRIFDNLSLDIEKGKFITLMSNCGFCKTSLGYLFLGLLDYRGTIKVFGQDLRNFSDSSSHDISVVFENSTNQFVGDTVEEELMISLAYLGYSEEDMKKRVSNLVKKFEIKPLLFRNPQTLSCGEKQIVALASAVINNPKILILDNALCMVDNGTKIKMINVLKKFQKEDLTIINMTCNSEEILLGNEVIIVKDGNVILNKSVKGAITCEKEFTSVQLKLPFMAELCIKLKYYNVLSKMELNCVKLVNGLWK